MRIFVGTDATQDVATRVLEFTIREHATGAVEVVPMKDLDIPRPKDKKNRPRTGFSMFRFVIPKLCGYRGRALYVDADMQVFADVAELWRIPFGSRKILCTHQAEPPAAWKHNSFFRPGRQFSVMLLDCARLPWDIEEIVRGLDEERYTYPQLMFEMCLVQPDEIGDDLSPAWNCLEHYTPGVSKLVHYTVVPTQPWKTDDNPLNDVWMAAYRRAVAAGVVPPHEVLDGIRAGHLKPSLADALHAAPTEVLLQAIQHSNRRPAPGSEAGDDLRLRQQLRTTQNELEQVRADLTSVRNSWTWRLGRAVTRPLGRVYAAFRNGR